MLGRYPEHELEEKVVAVDQEDRDDEGDYAAEALQIAESCPIVLLKHVRLQLAERRLQLITANVAMSLQLLALALRRVVDPVDAHGAEPLERVVAEDDADEVAAEQVEEQVVPPALVEVGQPVPERDLADLESDRARPRHVPVAHDQELAPPAEEVCDEVHIEDGIAEVGAGRCRVLRGEEAAVFAVAALGKGNAQVVVEDAKGLPGLIDG